MTEARQIAGGAFSQRDRRAVRGKGGGLGPELIVNGDFATGDLTGWTVGLNGGTGSVNAGTGAAVIAGDGVNSAFIRQLLTNMPVGRKARLQFTVTGSAAGMAISGLTSAPVGAYGPGVYNADLVISNSTVQFQAGKTGVTPTVVDNVSIKLIG